jgi:hypothetical protein
MAINFPTSLDTLAKPTNSQAMNAVGALAGDVVSDQALAIEALQAKVGADSSAVTTSHDWKLARFTFSGASVGIGGTPTVAFEVIGAGYIGAPDVAGSKLATIQVWDSSGAGGGGAIEFAGHNSRKSFAAIKGYLTNGGTNGAGHLDFYPRNAVADTAMTLRMRIKDTGQLEMWMPTVSATRGLDVGAIDSAGAGFRTVRVAN